MVPNEKHPIYSVRRGLVKEMLLDMNRCYRRIWITLGCSRCSLQKGKQILCHFDPILVTYTHTHTERSLERWLWNDWKLTLKKICEYMLGNIKIIPFFFFLIQTTSISIVGVHYNTLWCESNFFCSSRKIWLFS